MDLLGFSSKYIMYMAYRLLRLSASIIKMREGTILQFSFPHPFCMSVLIFPLFGWGDKRVAGESVEDKS